MSETSEEGFRSGFATLVGRPNVGKSTLCNRLVGEKVAIVSEHPQTTRRQIRGVRTTPASQIVLLDTPGLHRPRTPLGRRTNARALATLEEADVICQLVDATAAVGAGDRFVARAVAAAEAPAILVVNKVDAASPAQIPRQLAAADTLGPFDAFVPVSAKSGEGTDALLAEIEVRLPEGPRYYPDGMASDQPETVLAAELLREQLLAIARDELPHSIAVSVEELDDEQFAEHRPEDEAEHDDGVVDSNVRRLRAVIHVERESQKGIVIGRGGSVLRDAGTKARRELEAATGARVYLATTVRVDRNWQRRGRALDRLGF